GRPSAGTADGRPTSDDDGRVTGAGRDLEEGGAHTSARAASKKPGMPAALKRGHGLTYLCLFIFTVLLYLRPSEIYPSAFTNNIALHLVTIAPIAVALAFASRGLARKLFYGGAALLMLAAIVVTYSRGGFLGMACAFGLLAWKLGRRHRLAVFAAALFLLAGLLVFAPGNYALRLLSILVPSLDPVGSSAAREGELVRSLWVAIRRPVFGVGMGNY